MSEKTTWKVDPLHTEMAFSVKHMMISKVRGNFEKFDATIKTDNDDFKNADVEVTLQTASINTKVKDRDNHLRSDDFFNAEKYPEIKFKSKSFDGNTLIGDLTIRDITKEIKLEAEFNGIAKDGYGQTKAGFDLTGSINRKEYGLKWNGMTEAGNLIASDKITLLLDAQFVKQ